MTALAPNIEKPNDKSLQNKVTAISVTARIDYVLRFSKQLVLVVDQDAQHYSNVASQYLSALSQSFEKSHQSINVAFVSASTKLNDIQMRCRIIEQLFANTLFDPEQSLAVSIIKLANQQQQDITIVLDHAQALSLQLKYELSQLVVLSGKAKIAVNVVLFSSHDAVRDIASNKELFKGKVTVVDANSGQIIKANQPQFSDNTKLASAKMSFKVLFSALAIVLFTSLSYFAISQYEGFSLSELPDKPTLQGDKAEQVALENNKSSISNQKDSVSIEPNESAYIAKEYESSFVAEATLELEAKPSLPLASNKEIVNAIVDGSFIENATEIMPAETSDVLSALANTSQIKEEVVSENNLLNASYYLEKATGFTVQIAGFSKLALWEKFISEHSDLALYSYKRQFAESQMIVVTTQVFATKALASKALSSLPEQIKARGPWIKPNSAIVREINTFKQ